jgi:hypothetical protein
MPLGFLYVHDPNTKNNPRNGESGSPHPKKFKTQKSSSKVLVSIFWDKGGVLLVDNLEKGALLDKLKQQLVSKSQSKLPKVILFLHKAALTHQKLAIFTLKF